jgi:flagellar basal-body rod protein FlgF
MNGAREAMRGQSVVAHNIANASTTGFREVRRSLDSQAVPGGGFDTRVNPVSRADGWNTSTGPAVPTGRDLDVAVQGQGWIAVQAKDGSETYTRAGNLRINTSGLLETASGDLVKGSGGPISIPPFEQIYIGDDGQISVVPQGQTPEGIAVVDRIKLVNPPPQSLVAAGHVFRTADGSDVAADATVRIASGQLESSNVNATAALVEMIEQSRAYEMQVRLMHTADENDAAAARLIRANG